MATQHSGASGAESLVFGSVDEFADAVSTLSVPWEIRARSPRFAGGMRRRKFEECLFGEMQYGACTGLRNHREIALSDQPYMCLSFYTEGLLEFTHGSSTMQIGKNDLLLWDGAKPSMFECLQPTRCKLLWVPTAAVERRVGPIGDFLGQKMPLRESPARLLARHVEVLHNTIGELPQSMRASVLDASIDLIFSCFRPREVFEPTGRVTQLLLEAKAEIARRIEHEQVRPHDVARAMGISVRYLHRIFAASGTTFSTHANEERLERARRELDKPRSRHRTLTAIAHQFGFCDLSHFNRLFSHRYGVRPAVYRSAN